jgi:REP element-mobilizing transposase RayT
MPPKIGVSSFKGYCKGKSVLMLFDKHANLKYKISLKIVILVAEIKKDCSPWFKPWRAAL